MAQKYKALLIGLGRVAWRYPRCSKPDQAKTHYESYLNHKKVICVGGVDVSERARVEFHEHSGLATYSDFAKALDSEDIDIVSICTPNSTHYDYLKTALEREIPMIWLEKPAVSTLTELESITKLTQSSKSKITVNYFRRYEAATETINRHIIDKTLGELIGIELKYSRGMQTNGVHLLDLVSFFLGDNLKFEVLNNITNEDPTFHFASLVINDVPVSITRFSQPFHDLELILTFDSGRASLLYGGNHLRIERRVENTEFPGFFHLEMDELLSGENAIGNNFISVLEDLIESHEEDKESKSSLIASKQSLSLLERLGEQP